MRELKFRALDKAQNKYIDPGRVRLHGNGSVSIMGFGWSEDIEIELHTGLHDADGREIYEGDIFEAPHDFGPGGFAVRRASVAFHPERGYQWQYWLLDELRVIGNIHESPELLNND